MRIIIVIVFGLIVTGCASVPSAPPQRQSEPLIVRNGNDYVRLGREACGHLPGFLTGDAMLEGKPYRLCWRAMVAPRPHVLLVFEDGDIWRTDAAQFRPESQVPRPSV